MEYPEPVKRDRRVVRPKPSRRARLFDLLKTLIPPFVCVANLAVKVWELIQKI